MGINRIIPEIRSADLATTIDFYTSVVGLNLDMQMEPAFLSFGSPDEPAAQLIVNDNGHSGLPPGFAIDVGTPDRVEAIHADTQRRGLPIVEPLATKSWGIRRFSLIDPGGTRVTIIAHVESTSDAGGE